MSEMVRIEKRELARLIGAAMARRAWMGEVPGGDRLLPLPVQDIIERAWILKTTRTLRLPPGVSVGATVDLPQSSIDVLNAIKDSPSPEELGDLGFVDVFFAPPANQATGQLFYASKLQELVCTGAITFPDSVVVQGGVNVLAPPPKDNPFFCPARPSVYGNFTLETYLTTVQKYFNVDTAKSWGEVRPIILNIENLLKLTGDPVRTDRPSYPWPGSVKIAPNYWWEINQSGLNELVRYPGVVTQDAARLWVTLSILKDWNKLSEYARSVIVHEARTEKTALVSLTVALAIFGIVLGIAIGPLIAGGFKLAAGALTNEQKQEAANSLSDAAKELRSTEPAFAGEVQWSSDYIRAMMTEISTAETQKAAAAAAASGSSGAGGGVLEAAVGIGLPTLLSVGASLISRSR